MTGVKRTLPTMRAISGRGQNFWSNLKARFTGRNKRLEGERIIYVNNPPLNDPFRYCDNYISTSKYNLVTFLPKFLAGELTFYSLHAWSMSRPGL